MVRNLQNLARPINQSHQNFIGNITGQISTKPVRSDQSNLKFPDSYLSLIHGAKSSELGTTYQSIPPKFHWEYHWSNKHKTRPFQAAKPPNFYSTRKAQPASKSPIFR